MCIWGTKLGPQHCLFTYDLTQMHWDLAVECVSCIISVTDSFFVMCLLSVIGQCCIIPCGKLKLPYIGEIAARAVPIPTNVCSFLCVSKQWCGCQCSGFLIRAQLLMAAIAQGSCMNTIRVCTESWFWEKNPLLHWGIRNQTCFSIAPGFSTQCSTNWAILPV